MRAICGVLAGPSLLLFVFCMPPRCSSPAGEASTCHSPSSHTLPSLYLFLPTPHFTITPCLRRAPSPQILIKASPHPPSLPSFPSPPSSPTHPPAHTFLPSLPIHTTQTLTGRKQSFNFEPEEKVCVRAVCVCVSIAPRLPSPSHLLFPPSLPFCHFLCRWRR